MLGRNGQELWMRIILLLLAESLVAGSGPFLLPILSQEIVQWLYQGCQIWDELPVIIE